MAIVVVATQSTAFGSSGGTTANNNTIGSDLIIVEMSYARPSTPTLSDNMGNSYTQSTKYEDTASNGSVMVWYTTGAISTTSSHTFTTNCRLGITSIIAVSGARTATTAFDKIAGTYSGSMPVVPTPFYPGSITPSVDNCLVVTQVYQNAAVGAPTVPSGYTLIGKFAVGTSFPGGAAYKIQSTAAAENPGWGVDTSANVTIMVANFMPPIVGAVASNYNFFVFFN